MRTAWLPPGTSGAGGSSVTARGQRTGFWPDNKQVREGVLLGRVLIVQAEVLVVVLSENMAKKYASEVRLT